MMEELNDSVGIAISNGNIGLVYDEIKDNQTALEYYQKALKINKSLNRYEGIIINLNNIGHIYIDLEQSSKAKNYFLNQKNCLVYKEIQLTYPIAISAWLKFIIT
ncbi:hypothetical protein DCC35_08215 [Mangrovivirga cuniculi]|uniref:Uncharacterized protein n=2 Tax=Mangrovivirga cuniculi TaxID=2715131 RepID=A0A4D7JV58_9BACT|nr:hypothetical protein DCC35_08215 [Mangrovivirga cuniculi]